MIVGLTGGIGSGKTTVRRIFESLGIPTYDADKRAKELMYRDRELKAAVKELLGPEAYHRNGRLNRRYIASQIFTDKVKLKAINNLVHPAVSRDGERWADQQNSIYVIKEAALLVENGSYKNLDKLIVVTAPDETRITRVMKRDKVEADAVRSRVKSQLPQEEKEKVADYIIDNGGSISLVTQVWDIHQELVNAAKIELR